MTKKIYKGGSGYERDLHLGDETLEKEICEVLETKREPQGVKLPFMVLAIHGRDIRSNVALVIDGLLDVKLLL